MLEFEFMQKAFIVGILLAMIIPLVGVIVVLRRLSMTGDALSHSSLAGVAIGLLFGFHPILGAIIACIVAALLIELIRKKFEKYSEIATSIIMSLGIGSTALLSGFVPYANLDSYLFGSIVAMSDFEYYATFVIFFVVVITFIVLYKELMYVAFDEKSAALSKVPVKLINFIFTILTALTVAIAAKTIGALIVTSLMVIPVACSLLFAKSFKATVLYSIAFALLFVLSGLTVSFYGNVKPSGAIVLIGVGILFISFLVRWFIKTLTPVNHSIKKE